MTNKLLGLEVAQLKVSFLWVALFPPTLRVIVVKAIFAILETWETWETWESWKEVKVMQAGQLTIATPNVRQMNPSSVTGRIADWMARIFGCWHMEMSRPFSHEGQAYRVCVD